MNRGGRLPPFSAKRLAEFAAEGIRPTSTFRARPAANRAARRQRYTGPPQAVCRMVDKRSGRMCEWPGCPRPQDHRHHRLDRGMGGRHGEMHDLINGAAWLLAACFEHHERVTNPVGEVLAEAKANGWVLIEGQDATTVPVLTRHAAGRVLLDNLGGWHQPKEDVMTDRMTFGQVWVLNFVEDFRAANGALPSVATIALGTGLGEGTVRCALARLAELGYLPGARGWAA